MKIIRKTLISATIAATLAMPATAQDASPVPTISSAQQIVSASAQNARQPDIIGRMAASYGTFQSDVGDIQRRGLNSTADVNNALDKLAGQNSAQLSRGWLAYAALIASQSPELRTSIRDVVSAYGTQTIASGLQADRQYVRRDLNGGEASVSLAFSAIAADARRLNRTASYFREQAFALQGASWAKTKMRRGEMDSKINTFMAATRTERSPRGEIVSAIGHPSSTSAYVQAGMPGAPSLWDGSIAASTGISFPSHGRSVRSSQHTTRHRGRNDTADQVATLAAFRIMGANPQLSGQIRSTIGEGPMSPCIRSAQLNVNQCIASNAFPFETVDCIGKHAIGEVSECFSNNAR
ncbi:MAG: hypothetical protein ABJG15_18180 [Hyphomonadaceae bacterium]